MPTILVVTFLVMCGCGGGGAPEAPSPPPTPEPFPSWRMNRSDAVNWLVGHLGEGQFMWGAHMMAPILEGNSSSGRIIFVKISPYNYEVLDYDSAFIYHREDHAGRWNGGATWSMPEAHSAYTWRNNDGGKTIWMPRMITPGFTFANEANKYAYSLGSCEVDRVFRNNVYVKVVGLETIDIGGQAGRTETLHHTFYHPGSKSKPGMDTGEHYWYSWDYGWVKWSDATGHVSTFNEVKSFNVTYETPCIDTEFGR